MAQIGLLRPVTNFAWSLMVRYYPRLAEPEPKTTEFFGPELSNALLPKRV